MSAITNQQYIRAAQVAAAWYDVPYTYLQKGSGRKAKAVEARRALWAALYRAGFSLSSIDRAAGFSVGSCRSLLQARPVDLEPAFYAEVSDRIEDRIPVREQTRANILAELQQINARQTQLLALLVSMSPTPGA